MALAPAWFRRRYPLVTRQDLTLVAGSLAVGAVLYPLMVVPAFGGRVGGTLAVELITTFLALCVAQLFRRQAPVQALAVGTVLVLIDVVPGPSIPAWIVYADLLYAATLHGPQRLSRYMVPIATVLAALLMITLVALDPAWQDGLVTAVGAIPLVLIPVAWGRNVRHHKEIASAERRFAEQAARIADLDRASAVHAERNRIARDLHDVVAGHVASIALQAEAVVSSATSATSATAHDPAVRDLVGRMREESVRALREMRSMIDVLRADGVGVAEDSAPGKLADVPHLVDSARSSGLRVELRPLPAPEELTGTVELTAYRIVQEALLNACKHAPNCDAQLTISHDGASLLVDLRNDVPLGTGPTAVAETGGGRGLVTMRERAEAVGGRLTAGPDGDGWQVRAALPRLP